VKNPFAPLFERRSIGTSHELLQYLLRGSSTVAGISVNEASALNVAAVWTGLQIRSSLLSALPVDVIEYSEDGKSRMRRPNHPAARVLAKPNKWQVWPEFSGMLEAHRVFRGNCFAWMLLGTFIGSDGVERDQILELIPMHPDQVEVNEPDQVGGETEYTLNKKNGQRVSLPAREVLHLKNLSLDGRMGRGFMTDLREVIGGSLALQEHANSLWSRDATPSVALMHPGKLGGLGSTATKNIEESWEQIYGRGKEKRRVAVLEEGMKIEQLSLAPDEGQFLQTKQDMRAEIAAALMVPPHMMGLTEKVTSWGTGIEQQQIGLMVFTMLPAVRMWEARLNRGLITRPEKFSVKFNIAAMLRGDALSQAQAFWMYRQMGCFSANDILELLDRNPIPNGDIYLQPTNLAPLGFVPAGSGSSGATA
jgi:HK97 family phage portal protein